ncbi:restriction endonuclease subunit S [Streptococcus sp. 27098_8_73]|uniref:restriction endonuclease subunit S n=1 Tax=Streptococcus sp. 27098_8_73 TaxID=3003668 RepID=UPI00352F0574
MAQAIFKSWFIDFEPFGGVKPFDWKTANLTDIAEFLNGLAMQKYRPLVNEESLPVLKIKELRQGIFDSSSDLCSANIKRPYIIQDGDVIFSWSGSLLVDFWTGGIGGLNQHLFKVSSQEYDKWFYYSWTKYYLDEFIAIAADKATTMGHITRKSLEKAEILIPNDHDYKYIGLLLAPTYNQIISNRIENRKLMEVRNSLLPKLLSGEIPVNQATK